MIIKRFTYHIVYYTVNCCVYSGTVYEPQTQHKPIRPIRVNERTNDSMHDNGMCRYEYVQSTVYTRFSFVVSVLWAQITCVRRTLFFSKHCLNISNKRTGDVWERETEKGNRSEWTDWCEWVSEKQKQCFYYILLQKRAKKTISYFHVIIIFSFKLPHSHCAHRRTRSRCTWNFPVSRKKRKDDSVYTMPNLVTCVNHILPIIHTQYTYCLHVFFCLLFSPVRKENRTRERLNETEIG